MNIIGYENIITNSTITPNDFLEWAKRDFKGGDNRSLGNCLGNIKKSIHSRIDEIINQTRVIHCNDWNKFSLTDTKLECLKILGIKYRSIITPLTRIRNKFEHDYILPSKDDIEMFLEITDLWLEKSYRQYYMFSVAISKLPTENFGIYQNFSKNIENITNLSFDKKISVVYFNDKRKEIIKLDKNGNEIVSKYADLKWKEMIRLESSLIKPVIETIPNNKMRSRILKDENIEFLYNSYKNYLKDNFKFKIN
jgi:hypothetical protein